MPRLTFITFCLEHYADHKKTTAPEIYKQFRKEGLLELLKTDYEDLHGMSFKYLNQPTQEPASQGRQSGRGMVVLVRYLTQGTYPLVRGKPQGMYPSHTINFLMNILRERNDIVSRFNTYR
jgi:hypothetical protein